VKQRLCHTLELAEQLKTTRHSIIRYENGSRRIPGMAEVALNRLETAYVSLTGVVSAGEPIEAIPQTERVEVPKSMMGRGETFALRVKGTSMQDEGILPGDVVVVQKQRTARNGQTVIALVNGEATIKTYHRNAGTVELHPANDAPTGISSRQSFLRSGSYPLAPPSRRCAARPTKGPGGAMARCLLP
jgi:repressor LexA